MCEPSQPITAPSRRAGHRQWTRYVAASYLAVALAGVDLAGCDGQAVAPRTPNSTIEAVTRVSAGVNLSTYVVSLSQVGLQWNDNAVNEAGWEVHRSTNGASGTYALQGTMTGKVTSYLDTALAQLTEYCYEVRSFRLTGSTKAYDAFSNASCTTTPSLAPPTNVRVAPGLGSADVSWTNSVSQTDSTRLERSAQVGGPWQRVVTFTASNLPNATTYRESGLPLEQPVCYRLIAVNRWGVSNPSNAPCTVPIAPPSDLVAVSRDARSVTLTWKDNSAYEDGYVVSRGTDGYSWSAIADLPPNATSYIDATLALDARYAYHVQAKKDGAVTIAAGPVWIAIASGPPLPPIDVNVSPASSTATGAAWHSPSVTATSFRVERSTDGQATWQAAGTNTYPSFSEGGRVPEQEVCYRVYASNSLGESPASQVGCTRPPLGPTNVTIVVQNDGSQLVSWTDNSSVEDSYIVQVSYDPCSAGGCQYDCYPDGCYAVNCNTPEGCARAQIEYGSYLAAANATSQLIASFEVLEAVYAVRDGGYSDAGTFAGALTAAGASLSATRAPSAKRHALAKGNIPRRPVKRR